MARKMIIIGYVPKKYLGAIVGLCFFLATGLTLSFTRGGLLWITAPPGSIAGKIVVVDPGHGGADPGCLGKSGIREKEIVLPVAKLLAGELKKMNLQVYLTRDQDRSLAGEGDPRQSWKGRDLDARVEIANQAKADLFLSIHANSFPEPIWAGAQTFYYGSSPESKRLAEAIQDALVRELGPNRRRALAADFRVLRKSKMPGCVVEIGFLSNPREEKLLQDPAYQKKVAKAIAQGVRAYFNAGYQAARGRGTVAVTAAPDLEQMRRLRGSLGQEQVLLYFGGLDNGDALIPVVHSLKFAKEKLAPEVLARTIVEALIAGPKEDNVLYRTVPPETRLLGLEIHGGVATINFSKEFVSKHWATGWNEELTVYSVVNSLTELPQIQKVKFLVEGESNVTIGGHLFLDQVFQRRDDVVLPVQKRRQKK